MTSSLEGDDDFNERTNNNINQVEIDNIDNVNVCKNINYNLVNITVHVKRCQWSITLSVLKQINGTQRISITAFDELIKVLYDSLGPPDTSRGYSISSLIACLKRGYKSNTPSTRTL